MRLRVLWQGRLLLPRALSRDEARYPAAEKYMPERFLDAEGMLTDDDPSDFVFGFGRRKCPGRVFHSTLHVLSTSQRRIQADTARIHPSGAPSQRCLPRSSLISPRMPTETTSRSSLHSRIALPSTFWIVSSLSCAWLNICPAARIHSLVASRLVPTSTKTCWNVSSPSKSRLSSPFSRPFHDDRTTSRV